MGRRPNSTIAAYFERGPKLKDNSNRYPHRCKACGEDFPKGRIDSLTNHLTKKCPAISEAERVNACLSLAGMGSPARRAHHASAAAAHSADMSASGVLPTSSSADSALSQTNWTALETLAEVSRQIDLSEKHDDHIPSPHNAPHDVTQAPFGHTLSALASNLFEPHEQFTLDNPPMSYDNRPQHELSEDLHQNPDPRYEMSTEDKLRSLLASADDHPMETNLSMAAAATARLNPSLMDPQLHLLHQEIENHQPSEAHTPAEVDASAMNGPDTEMGAALQADPTSDTEPAVTDAEMGSNLSFAPIVSTGVDAGANVSFAPIMSTGEDVNSVEATAPNNDLMMDFRHDQRPSTPNTGVSSAAHDSMAAWGEMTYISENLQPPATVSDQSQQLAYTLNKGGFRMDTLSPNGTRQRPTRARFDPTRRKEVQEVRRIGACIRCRILRKVCSKGTPCETCRKVLSPRLWHTGCIRTRLAEQIELYSAGVQIVVAQKRVNRIKMDFKLSNTGATIVASHFHETGHQITLQVLQGLPTETENPEANANPSPGATIMIDNDNEDVPAQVETYMRRMLPEFINRETSSHVRVTLECAQKVAHDTNDELLRRSLELWGLTEIMDRERQWSFVEKTGDGEYPEVWLKDQVSNGNHENETFTTFCTQLTAAAERKAALISKSLLNGIQRNLQDAKIKLGFPMFLTCMIFLNCVEKMTWSFKAWEGEALRLSWPLEKQPADYYNQGYPLCDLLKMLLNIRHILPKVQFADGDQPIQADDDDETIKKYYDDLNVTPNFLRSREEQFSFDQSDSRSLEFLFCSALLQS
ncbi:hypothetical protein JX265_012138 [Neoarthrinium moseri]|uniref:Uncharacterized protein n=1 Tax=Neoarthrinium moseri TaxID=1658444 RepID=A0A9P9WAW8_9PEZI|nr:uncharacterized protein JN550_001308 [Neoarthrinium moseri]KAI1849301.1 hypothetical protein JX266_004796 [Neoarthrinium moseri]KAI1855875.1 hypothetical protein JX265_012138 [Neoarthrinium moseri]KAI1877236.1 hypothetical protein JN550_001308 [Neoarthrinium moseri]